MFNNSEKMLEKARELNDSHNFQESLEILDEIKEDCKDNPLWYYRKAYALTYSNRFHEALNTLMEGLSKSKEFPGTYELLAELYYWKGEYIKAFEAAKRGRNLCREEYPENLWQFNHLLESMYRHKPYVNKLNYMDSVIFQEFNDYDDSADADFKIKDNEEELEKLEKYFGHYDREYSDVTVFINGKLEEDYYMESYFEPLSMEMDISALGIVESCENVHWQGKIKGFHIHVRLYKDREDCINRFLRLLLRTCSIPKGSYLLSRKQDKIIKTDIGSLEILALEIDREPDRLIYNFDLLNDLVAPIHEKLMFNNEGQLYSSIEDDDKITVYFIGPSYEEMEKTVSETVKNSVCENARIYRDFEEMED